MKKKIMTLVLTTAMTAAAGLTAFAGEWKSNDTGWWWLNDDGSNPAAEWKWLDGNKDGTFECYYFGNDGYMLSDTTTPDNYQVNKDGAWIVDGVVQQMFLNTDDPEYYITESEYDTDSYDSSNDGYSLSANTVVWLSRTGTKFHSNPGCRVKSGR